jgi:hypothetical protein
LLLFTGNTVGKYTFFTALPGTPSSNRYRYYRGLIQIGCFATSIVFKVQIVTITASSAKWKNNNQFENEKLLQNYTIQKFKNTS